MGCSGTDTSSPNRTGEPTTSAARLPSAPRIPPQIPDVSELDTDGDRIDDRFADEEKAVRNYLPPDVASFVLDAPVAVEAIFGAPIGAKEISEFEREGGSVRHVFKHVSYGFTGRVPRRALARTAKVLGPNLLVLHATQLIERHLDEATRTGRARPVWPTSFHGGYSGSSNITIAIMDTGVDVSHPDLAGRMVGFKDYSCAPNDVACTNANYGKDFDGHGTHVAGVAVGSGAAFGPGPGTLQYTDSGDLTARNEGAYPLNPVHLPPNTTVTSTATWLGGGTTRLSLTGRADGTNTSFTTIETTEGPSPLHLTFNGAIPPGLQSNIEFRQNAATSIQQFAITNSVTNYPAVGDGFNVLRGVAAGASWYGAKIYANDPNAFAETGDIVVAMDDIIDKSVDLKIKVANMSFSVSPDSQYSGADSTQRAKANTMVDNGIVVIVSAGNHGPGKLSGDPGRAAKVITVGATNDQNALTSYTSGGFTGGSVDTDVKPDLVAPGGSSLRSLILSADTNNADARRPAFDKRADDYTSIQGTSMAAPFVAGAAALLIQALEQSGTPWTFGSTASPFLVKLLLLASSTETNRPREAAGGNPTLGRGLQQKDNVEGYGLVNPDAAIEAATISYDFAPFTGTTTGNTSDRRAWGRKLVVPAGRTLKLTLDMADTSDFDLYVYASQPDTKGNPILVSRSDRADLGAREELTRTFDAQTTLYAFVKRISGSGAFTLNGSVFSCGDGHVDNGEECDVGPDVAGDCCSATCQFDDVGTDCGAAGSCTNGGVCGPYIEQDAGAGLAVDAGGPKPAGVIIDDTTAPPGVSSNDGTVGGGGACATGRRGSSESSPTVVALCAVALLYRRRPRRS